MFTDASKKRDVKRSVCKVRTQDPENFDEEVKSLVTAWRVFLLSFLFFLVPARRSNHLPRAGFYLLFSCWQLWISYLLVSYKFLISYLYFCMVIAGLSFSFHFLYVPAMDSYIFISWYFPVPTFLYLFLFIFEKLAENFKNIIFM